MKTKIQIVALIAASALWFVGCDNSPLPTITNINTNTNILNGGGSVDPNAAPSQCLESEQTPIRVDLNVPVVLAVGVNGPIDATPKSANGKRSDGCNILQGIQWSTVGPCTVPNPSEFTTVMRCTAVGSCQISAQVPGKGASGTATVACQ